MVSHWYIGAIIILIIMIIQILWRSKDGEIKFKISV